MLESLRQIGLVNSADADVGVTIGKDDVRVRVTGVNCREESLFVGALREIFDPLQSPRYLLVTKDEEFAVPRVFAERKERAEAFARSWRHQVGRSRLMFSHTPEGKLRLLRAKERFLASQHPLRTDSRMRWG